MRELQCVGEHHRVHTVGGNGKTIGGGNSLQSVGIGGRRGGKQNMPADAAHPDRLRDARAPADLEQIIAEGVAEHALQTLRLPDRQLPAQGRAIPVIQGRDRCLFLSFGAIAHVIRRGEERKMGKCRKKPAVSACKIRIVRR